MGLKEKLMSVKDTVAESMEELVETSDLTAEEYAKYFGASYVNFLNYIRKQQFDQRRESFAENNEQPSDNNDITVILPITSIKNKEIIFNDEEFGTKEKFNMTILGNILYKARISYEISEDLSTMILTEDKSERIADRLEKLSESKDAYISKAKDIVNTGNQLVRTKTKDFLKNLSNWADTNL